MAKKKEGQIAIIPNYIDETELLLTTGLTTEDWSRDMPGQGR